MFWHFTTFVVFRVLWSPDTNILQLFWRNASPWPEEVGLATFWDVKREYIWLLLCGVCQVSYASVYAALSPYRSATSSHNVRRVSQPFFVHFCSHLTFFERFFNFKQFTRRDFADFLSFKDWVIPGSLDGSSVN